MHICFSTIDYHGKTRGGGIASYLDAIAPELVRMGHEVTIVGPGKERQHYQKDGVEVYLLPLGQVHYYLYKLHFPSWIYLPIRELEWSRHLSKEINRIHREKPIDVVESHEIGLYFLAKQKRRTFRLIVRLHGSQYIFRKFLGGKVSKADAWLHQLELKLLKCVDGITAPGFFQKKMYESFGQLSIVHIPNPFNPKLLDNFYRHQNKEKADGLTEVLFTGRMDEIKGISDLFKAIKTIDNKNITFTLAGARHNSVSNKKWDMLLKDCSGAVNYVGHQSSENIAKLYARADIFVMPSYYETFGISVLEAMVFGLPVVCTKAGALEELISPGENGLLVENNNPKQLADAIEHLVTNKAERLRMGENNKAKALKLYHPKVVATAMMEVYAAQAGFRFARR